MNKEEPSFGEVDKASEEIADETAEESTVSLSQYEKIKDDYLRLAADFDNYKKRAEKEKENLNGVHQQNNASLFGAHTLIPPPSEVSYGLFSRAGSSTDPTPTRPRLDNMLEGRDVTKKIQDYHSRIHNPMTEFKENFRKKISKQQKGERNGWKSLG